MVFSWGVEIENAKELCIGKVFEHQGLSRYKIKDNGGFYYKLKEGQKKQV